jgi:protein-tyrosine phosphatase
VGPGGPVRAAGRLVVPGRVSQRVAVDMSEESKKSEPVKVLFVCLGNICRSPVAEGVFRHLVTSEGLEHRFEIDSAGTSSYHEGEPPDRRAAAEAARRGIRLTGRARGITLEDVERFDYVVVMDRDNLAQVQRLARRAQSCGEVRLLREFDSEANGDLDVPDPYYGGPKGFELVHDIDERSCRALLDHIRTERAF